MEYKTELDSLIETVIAEGASDLHLTARSHPIIRVSGALIPLVKKPAYAPDDVIGLLAQMISPEKKDAFLEMQEIDFSYQHKDKVRFRGNAFFQQGTVSIALRLIPKEIKTIAELNLPQILESFCQLEQGFFLVVGPEGLGKSTTLKAMIEGIK